LDVGKVEASFKKNLGHYVGLNGSGAGQQSRYDHVGRVIQSGYPIFMPHLSADDDNLISFTDGRHRFAWVRDHGAKAIPVSTYPGADSRLEAEFGTLIRECRVIP
jgi:hypothetical protein